MDSSKIAVCAENISKCYRIGLKEKMHDSIGGAICDFFKSPLRNYRKYRSLYKFDSDNGDEEKEHDDILWALRDVSFEIKKGEVLGVIGRNGAGKSTLLKILSRITDPTKGTAKIVGRVSSLLEVGTGFHPELTGRDNVYLNGAVLGMTKKEIDSKFDNIVNFSGVERFIDTPVKRYSSGMQVRLAFAVAAHLEPDILIVDEVLAVGDVEFQKKCLGKMEDITKERGRTILFVSHNMAAVTQLCSRAILLNKGSIAAAGETRKVVEQYLSTIFSHSETRDLRNAPVRKGDGRLQFVSVYLETIEGNQTAVPISGEPLNVVLNFTTKKNLARVRFMFTVFNQMGIAVTNCSVESTGQCFDVEKGEGQIICNIPRLPLPLGQYKIAVAAYDDKGDLDWVPTACIFNVESSNFFETSFVPPIRYSTALVDHSWQITTDKDYCSTETVYEDKKSNVI